MADGSLIFDTKLDTGGIKKGLGGIASTTFKALSASVVAATTAVTALGVSALSSYAEFEQLTGGVETLFKDSSGLVEQYAADAYKSAGLSANQYMSTVTSFSASLLQSLGGDTEAAAKSAEQAIIDMSDNANKMGTSMEMIQNAYQGFAKQNYTMLDNLKLGYGGTKEEMQRLLEDASALSGIEYDISSFSDVTEAIHVVQSEMGITGTTAKEASTTIEGSVNSMKAAWANLVTGIADDNADFDGLIQNFVDSVGTVGENVLPRLETIIGGIGELIEKLLPIVIAEIPAIINDVLPGLLQSGANMVQAILDGLLNNLPTIVTGAIEIISQLAMSILNMLPTILELGLQLIINLALGIAQALPELIPTIVEVITNMVQILVDNIPMLLDAAIQIMVGLTEGIIEALPVLIEALPAIIEGLINAIIEYTPQLIESTLYIMAMLVQAIFDNLPVLIDAIIQIILSLGETIVNQCGPMIDAFLSIWDSITEVFSTAWDNIVAFLTETIPALIVNIGVWFAELPGKIWTWLVDVVTKVMTWRDNMIAKAKDAVTGFIDKAIEIIKGLPEKIAEWLGKAVSKVQEWKSGLVEKAKDALSSMVTKAVETVSSLPDKMKEVGTNLIYGIWNGISNATQWLYEKISGFVGNVTDKIKSLFGIHSPSTLWRDEVGHWLGEGIVVGFDEDDPMGQINESLAKDVKGLSKSYAYAFDGMANIVPTTNLIAGVQSSAEVAKARATGISNNATQNINFNYPVQAPDEVARAIRQQDNDGLAGA